MHYLKVGDHMLSKYCDRCHQRLRIGEKCRCTYRFDHKVCQEDDFYQTKEWKEARQKCRELCCGLDLYSLYHGRVEYGLTVHHIRPVNLSPELKLTQSNLIYLTESNHKRIHSLYEHGQYETTVTLLLQLKQDFIEGVGLW